MPLLSGFKHLSMPPLTTIIETEPTPSGTTARKRRLRPAHAVGATVAVAVLLTGAMVFLAVESKKPAVTAAETGLPAVETPVAAKHQPIPSEVRGIYVTASTASSLSRYGELVKNVKAKGINSVVLDLKTETGSLAFEPLSKELKAEAPVHSIIKDIDAVIGATHSAGFYLIARIPVFEDPDYAAKHQSVALHRAGGGLWQDAKGLYWLDPAAESVWKYNADIAKEAYGRGFDEVQFDYIRFATDGATGTIVYPVYDPKKENFKGTIARLFDYFDKELRGAGIPTSVDVFGFVTWHQTDLGIGQWYADALKHFDFVSPMVYPSHYPSGTLGLKNPADHPYEIVIDSLKKGNEVIDQLRADDPAAKLGSQRPWTQAFNLGAVYTPEMILAQARASREAKAPGFLLWNAGNNYSSLPLLTTSH
jgi:hypothetical protein